MLSGLNQKVREQAGALVNWLHVTVASPVDTERLTHRVIYTELGKPVAFPLGKSTARWTDGAAGRGR